MPNLGIKYGLTVRRKYLAAWKKLKKKRMCPKCGSRTFARSNNGIWACGKCGYRVTGDAYEP
ncbi:MAG: hypothetical protein QXY52_00810 [Conexivisphaerales archaeon]